MLDLTVSIVAYKNYEDIVRAIASIEKYSSADINKKIYIVDNSCLGKENIDRVKFIQSLSAYSDVEYIDTGSNLGFGKGHNLMLNSLNSRYHGIVNPDILIQDNVFLRIMRYLNDENIGMCIPKLVDQSGKMQKVYRRELTIFDMFVRMFCPSLFPERVSFHTMQDQDYTIPFQVPFGQGSFLVIRTDLFKKLKGFDDRFFMYLEDADLCKRVNQESRLMYFPEATVIHKWEKGSHKSLKLFLTHVNSMRMYFEKWGIKII